MNAKEISQLMKQFETSNLNELRIAQNGNSVYFSKLNQPGAVAKQSEGTVPMTRSVKNQSLNQSSSKKSAPAPSHHQVSNPKPAGQTIKAPLVGIVYFAPSSKKPAFAKVGSHVKKGDVVCQIEAMKVLNDVKAPVSGTIVKRLVKNGSMVQYHQPVFAIKEG